MQKERPEDSGVLQELDRPRGKVTTQELTTSTQIHRRPGLKSGQTQRLRDVNYHSKTMELDSEGCGLRAGHKTGQSAEGLSMEKLSGLPTLVWPSLMGTQSGQKNEYINLRKMARS